MGFLSPLDTLIVSHFKGFVKGFLSFFKKLFEVPNCGWRLTLSPRTTMGLPHISWVRSYLPLTLQIIAHPIAECNRQNVQNRDFYFLDICATFRLTKYWRYAIMWMVEEDSHLYKSPGNFYHQPNRAYHNLARAKGADLSAPVMPSVVPKHRNFLP